MRPEQILGSLLAVAIACCLWIFSGLLEDQLGIEALLPMIRIIVVIGGLSLADTFSVKALHAISGLFASKSANGDHS